VGVDRHRTRDRRQVTCGSVSGPSTSPVHRTVPVRDRVRDRPAYGECLRVSTGVSGYLTAPRGERLRQAPVGYAHAGWRLRAQWAFAPQRVV